MERYYRIVYPTCDPEDTAIQKVSMFTLVNTAGMDKEKFLDIDGKNYCDTITYAACVEKNKWEFKTYINVVIMKKMKPLIGKILILVFRK